MTTKKTQATNSSSLLMICSGLFLLVNILFIIFIKNEIKTIKLLNNELKSLQHDALIIASSQQIHDTYKQEIETISVLKEPANPVASAAAAGQSEHHVAPPPMNLPTGSIAETKLIEMFRLPREEKKISAPVEEPATMKKRPYSVDPYREPLG